ncbi:uncharacterized protein [Atheta coriaria]|uniref:uncharacterized protein isoform X2 n=1 Tax=Dalotia coriaria TaxID=877792 RepID=UPI0031F37DAC
MLIRDEASNAIQYSKHLQLINTVLSLNIFTDYTVQLTKNNKIIHNIIFTTDESVPNKVRNITIISSSSSDLSVIWEAPTPVLGIITNYHVTWMFLAKRSCENENQNFIIQSRNVTTTAITLDNLKPYSIYRNTDATETNQLNTFNNKIITFETSIQIDLVVDCEHWSGPIYLNTYAICKSEWCEGEEMNRTKHLQYNDLITLDSLLPYTNYKLVLYQSHKNEDKFDNIYKLLSTNVMTRSTVPNQVPFAEVYSLSEASLSLRWSPPYPPTGILDSFIIKCHYISGGHSTQQTVNSFLNPCKIWPNMYCTTLTNLTANQNYIISIAGRNQGNSNYGVETVLNETTWIRAPQPPLNLIAKWDEFRILHLQWQHPNKTNGPFFRFKIRVNNYQYSYQESESATYTFKTQFQCNPEIHRAIVSVETHNSKFCSAFLTHQFICPIFKPSLQFNPSAIHNSNNSITISIPAIEYDEAISNLYIVLLVNESDNTCTGDCREKIGNNHDSLVPIKENQTCWIVGHYDQRKYREIEKTHVNLNLSQIPNFNGTGELFEVGIVIINELGDQISSNWYLVDQCKWEKMEFSSILVSLLVLTILGIIITSSILGLLLWRKNRRKENANQFCKKRVNGISFPLLSMEEAKKRANYH